MSDRPAALHVEPGVVRFQDVDAAGIVFFARVLDYFHDAYVAFLRARDISLEAALADGGWVAPIRSAEADYLRPLRFGDPFTVTLLTAEVEETEYSIRYRLDRGGETACTGTTRHVCVDPDTFRRTQVPERVRRALEP